MSANNGPDELKETDIIIPVMGITGSGKTSFISLCTQEPKGIGHGLSSFTSEVDFYSFKYEGRTVRLIDTPGFDDTKKPDTEILNEIAYWLTEAYSSKPKALLSGIVYLHPIHEPKMQGTAKKNLTMFKLLCGESSLPCVVLATTMWSKVSKQDGNRRQEELITTQSFWGEMIDNGSTAFKHTDNRDSALAIIKHIIEKKQSIVLDIQREMVEHRLSVNETTAGRELESKIISDRLKALKRLQMSEEELEEELRNKNESNTRTLLDAQEKYKKQIEAKDRELESMRLDQASLKREKEAQFEREEVARIAARQECEKKMADLSKEIERVNLNYLDAVKEAEDQELNRLELEKQNSSLVLRRDKMTGQEIDRVKIEEDIRRSTWELQKRDNERQQADMRAYELRSRMATLQRQIEEREYQRSLMEQEATKRLMRQGVMFGAAGASIGAASLGFAATGLVCSIL